MAAKSRLVGGHRPVHVLEYDEIRRAAFRDQAVHQLPEGVERPAPLPFRPAADARQGEILTGKDAQAKSAFALGRSAVVSSLISAVLSSREPQLRR